MSRVDIRWSQGVAPALVLLSEGSEHPIWDPELSEVLDAVEERLDAVHVTTAGMQGKGPSVDDATAAVRFSGASAAVVVFPREWLDSGLDHPVVDQSDRKVDLIPAPCEFTVDGIVEAYERRCVLAADLQSVAAGG
jgi:hypothetical protein